MSHNSFCLEELIDIELLKQAQKQMLIHAFGTNESCIMEKHAGKDRGRHFTFDFFCYTDLGSINTDQISLFWF